MPIYPSGGSVIGTLLRTIREEQATSPLTNLPGNQVGSPIRELVQGPVMQTESPESARMIAVRPESSALSGGQDTSTEGLPAVPGNTPSAAAPAAPIAPAAPQIGVTRPALASPAAPNPEPAQSNAPAQSSAPASQPNRPAQASLATQIRPSASPAPSFRPSTSSSNSGAFMQASKPQPSPSPRPQTQNAPGVSRVGGISLGTGAAAASKNNISSTIKRAAAPVLSIASRILPALARLPIFLPFNTSGWGSAFKKQPLS